MNDTRTDYMNLEEVADELAISIATAYAYARDGTIPAIKIGGIWRVSRAALDELFRSKETTDGQ